MTITETARDAGSTSTAFGDAHLRIEAPEK